MNKSRVARVGSVAALALVAIAEAATRLAGLTDFPTYEASADLGYLPHPSQHGRFAMSNDWAFNEVSMGVGQAFIPSTAKDVLLVGDSVVFGGNPYQQDEKLGPSLQRTTGWAVWPASAGSWAILNQVAYLSRHPQVARNVDEFVFVWNNGDFAAASSWTCDRTHPRHRPLFALPYLADRYLLRWQDCGSVPEGLKLPSVDWKPALAAVLHAAGDKPIRIFLYPDRGETTRQEFAELESLGRTAFRLGVPDLKVYSVGRDPRWRSSLYRDGIHPTPEGNSVLASIIASPMTPALK